MGFLTFLNRRRSERGPSSPLASDHTIYIRPSSAASAPTHKRLRKRSDIELSSQHSVTTIEQDVYFASTESGPRSPIITTRAPSAASQLSRQSDARAGGGPTDNDIDESITFAKSRRPLSLSSSYSDLLTARQTNTERAASLSRSVDLLDAHGQLGPSDFKARVQASGSRDYGEDVAERNIGQNGLILNSPAVQKFYAEQPRQLTALLPRRHNTSLSKYRKYAAKEIIFEDPEVEEAITRPSSRASSLFTTRSMPITHGRPASSCGVHRQNETLKLDLAKTMVAPNAMMSIGQPKLDTESPRLGSASPTFNDAFPPSIPRYRRTEKELPPARPQSAHGSVRRARQSIAVFDSGSIGQLMQAINDEKEEDGCPAPVIRCQATTTTQSLRHQNLSMENVARWKQSLDEVAEDARTVTTERATDSRASRRQWSIASTEPTEFSDASSIVNFRPASRGTANTSVDMRSTLEPYDKGSDKAGPIYDNDFNHRIDDIDTCSVTTDGSNIEAFMEKQKRKSEQEDESLLFNEAGFFNAGGALPGLFDAFQVHPAPVAEDSAEERCKSPTQKSIRSQTLRTIVSQEEVDSLAVNNDGIESSEDLADQTQCSALALVEQLGRSQAREESLKSPTLQVSEPEPSAPAIEAADHIEPELEDTEQCELERELQLKIDATGAKPAEEDDQCTSVGTPESVAGSFVPNMYLTQRQRLLALGFDYDTDDEELAGLDSDMEDEPKVLKKRNVVDLTPTPISIIIEPPRKTEDRIAKEAAKRRKEVKALSRGDQRSRIRRVNAPLRETDGNLADVE